MLVNRRSANKCCSFCDSDYGKSPNRKAKQKLKRTIRRRDKRTWMKEEV
jgi:hypothetical protein